ncbi:MAG TPA: neutral zinc metallopeptidase [Micropruina sp.]|nr:neutral zinc metallopeptidase [Micropruina sp.]HMR20508.1 neutral zinc metallopeptidase [Micropruina sp.]
MQYRESANLDSSQVTSSSGGGGAGGRLAVGGVGGLIIIVLAMFLGFDPSALLAGTEAGPQQTADSYAECRTGADIEANRDCRFVAYTNSIQGYWSKALPGYQATRTHIFTGSVSTGCGTATSAVGPFYCPADRVVYLDTGFFAQLTRQLGAKGGDAAEAYVIAHEYGHHISNLTGVLDRVQQAGNQTGPNSPQVKLELQADCYAGVWLANAAKDVRSPIASISRDDVLRAADAARSVGDDRIQEQATGRVDRESWTHGSAQQRETWLTRGFQTGDPNQCNTFAS